MCCPHVGAKFRSQDLSYMMANLSGDFPLREGDCCAQLDQMDLGRKIRMHMCLAPLKRRNLPTCLHVAPPTLRGDGHHLRLLKKPQICGSNSLLSP